jgi:hypothetical protein
MADDFQRTYSVAELRGLLADWELLDLSVAWRRDERTWMWGGLDEQAAEVGVALVRARRGAD